MPNSKQIVYLSQAQYAELIANGTITVNGVTVTYDENDIYVTPQAEPVTDVRVNGVSVTANGVVNIPTADKGFGVIQVSSSFGHVLGTNGVLIHKPSADSTLKHGTDQYDPVVAKNEHTATFYGLAKVAGHDEASSIEPLGTYTPEAKGAIQKMLGVSDLIATEENNLVASKAYAIGDVFTANGKLYKATAAIAADAAIITDGANANCEETSIGEGFPHDVQIDGTSVVSNGVANVPRATTQTLGVASANGIYGLSINNSGNLYITPADLTAIKSSSGNPYNYKPIVPAHQHESVFFGLAKASGDTTQLASDNAVGTYTDDAKSAIRTMLGAVGDVQVNGTSAVQNGVASVPIAQAHSGTNDDYGLVKINRNNGITIASDGCLSTVRPNESGYKSADSNYQTVTPFGQHLATFYGLAKAAGDTTQSTSSNTVGTYTDEAKQAIQTMLGIDLSSIASQVEIPLVETVDGAAVTITGQPNTRYMCGEVTSISITPPTAGSIDVVFTSGSTVAVLTLPSTVKMPEWFDASALETDTIYEILITDGVYGSVMTWTV